MMEDDVISLDQLPALERKVAALQRQADQAAGAYQELKKELKRRFGVSTIKEAETLLEDKKEAEYDAHSKYLEAFKRLKEEYPEIVDL